MNIITRPQALCFASGLNDYKIDSDSTLAFDVSYGGNHILAEEYSPDKDFMIQTHKLGKMCASALWGIFPTGDVTIQDKIAGDFQFLINGVADTTSTVIASRSRCNFPASHNYALTLSTLRTTHPDSCEWITFYMDASQFINVTATDINGVALMQTLYTSPIKQVVTIDVSPARIKALFPNANIIFYKVGNVTFRIDQTRYFETFKFRFLNNFDVPESVTATGTLTMNTAGKHTDAFIDGVERRVKVGSVDEYTVNSGVIFSQSDYVIWHELVSSRRVQMLVDEEWVDIIISKQKFDRDFRKNVLKQVNFSFHLADPDEGVVI